MEPTGGEGGAPPQPKSRLWLWLACCGCLTILILGAGGGGTIAWFVYQATEKPAQEARAFLEETGRADFAAAHARLRSDFGLTLDGLKEQVEANKALFQVTNVSFSQRNIENGEATLKGTMTSSVDHEQKYCTFWLSAEGDRWKIYKYRLSARPH